MPIPMSGFDEMLEGDSSILRDTWRIKNQVEDSLINAIDLADSFGPVEQEDEKK